ncbi:helix-turn-helix transcriptional regulator [Pediococcus pentosaceus]|uniref:helix-turn-helix domain-containing protein n=1 Tax=Pediococcus pentosaceus TaxID=1255 RepID=UPI0018E10D10|nr:helix-turn-helix transcriptional regulator [Pediococcus pentosaceus]MBF7103684.1 helix-turn-helix transcriptional regulator [Pediococcus pentosaceus]QQC61690.1 helix-turn-helix transcriptional regulator [Pediococcus pentosaceus]
MIFSSVLRKAREERKMSQIELIRKIHDEYGIDISTSMLSRYEDELTPLPRRMLIKAMFALSVYLDIDLNELARKEVEKIMKIKNSNKK